MAAAAGTLTAEASAGCSVPAGLAETVARHVAVSALRRDLLEQISAVNLELLARRELD